MMAIIKNRRRLLMFLGGVSAIGGYAMIKPQVVNACRVPLPVALIDSPFLKKSWEGIDPKEVWDMHVHLAGIGDDKSGNRVGQQLSTLWHPLHYAQRLFYMNAGCADDAPDHVDTTYVARLLNLCDAMPEGFKTMLFAFDYLHDTAGAAHPEHSAFFVPNLWAKRIAQTFPTRFEWVASLHPYAAGASGLLETAIMDGARAVKWLPAAMGMDPADSRCDAFYRVLAKHDLPLIVHCGEEGAVKGGDTASFGNPLRLRRALDAGVRVIVAHCATLGEDIDDDGAHRQSFDLFAKLMAEPRAHGKLYGDISALTLRNRRPEVVQTLLEQKDWHPFLLNGSDYPLPGILPLVSLNALVRAHLLSADAVTELENLREHNPLLFDFVLKRSLSYQGVSFPTDVFHTRRHFKTSNP